MQFEIKTASGDSPPLHVHPRAKETYRVLSGVLEVNVEGEWQEVPAGESHTVSAGIVSVKPPQVVMRILAKIGRLLGYRLPD